MIVNVASACGYTAVNYAGLQARLGCLLPALCAHVRPLPRQALYAEFAPQGFNVLAFPCDCFGNQEPGSDAEIKEFAHDKYGAEFQLFSKIKDVNGADAHPIFDWLQLQNSCTPTCESPLTWNFNKVRVLRSSRPASARMLAPRSRGVLLRGVAVHSS
jgi:glutathione peroxidase